MYPNKKEYITLSTDRFVITVLKQDGSIDEDNNQNIISSEKNESRLSLANLETSTTFDNKKKAFS